MAVIGSTYEPKEVLVISSPTSSTTDLRTTGTARQQPTCLVLRALIRYFIVYFIIIPPSPLYPLRSPEMRALDSIDLQ
eukprot:1177951-Prorocentrum_minimum.AAC.2